MALPTAIMNDGTADSNHDSVTITATNPDPVAIAVKEHHVLVGTLVELDGSESLPPTGGDPLQLEYDWSLDLDQLPEGSSATLSQTGTSIAGLYADVVGTYHVTLTASYQEQTSEPLNIIIVATNANTNAKPMADAGGPYTIERGQTLILDGTGSSDADGDVLSYRWFVKFPSDTGTELTVESALQNHTTATPSFTPDTADSWQVYLTVFDGISYSSESSATIEITLPDDATNTPPVAAWFPKPQVNFYEPVYSHEIELGAKHLVYGTPYDIDGTAMRTSNRRFRWISTPDGYEQEDLTGKGFFYLTPTVEGDYTIEMIVTDGELDSEPSQITYTARTGANFYSPDAKIFVDSSTVLVGSTAWFDGRTSSDPQNDELTYIWNLSDKPDGSNAALIYEDVTRDDGTLLTNARVGVVTDKPGNYFVKLAVKDSHGVTSYPINVTQGFVFAKSENHPPSINPEKYTQVGFSSSNITNPTYPSPGMDRTQPMVAGQAVGLFANAVDPDLDKLYYLWTVDEKPAGSAALEAGDENGFYFTCDLPGTYRVSLVVSDGIDNSEVYTTAFTVVEPADYPTLRLIQGNQSNTLPGVDLSRGAVPSDLATMEIDQGSSTTFPYQFVSPLGDSTKLFALSTSSGDYTIQDLSVTTDHAGTEQARLVGLTEGQVIREGETVNFALVYPSDFNRRVSRGDFRWQFKIKEREDFLFNYQSDIGGLD